MKKRLSVIAGVVALSVLLLVLSPISVKIEPALTSAANGDGCPEGSYNIGTKDGVNPICKLEPTGCPFGDSVPLDKCEPPPDIICNEDWTKCEPKKENEGNNGSSSEVYDSRSTEGKKEYSTCDSLGK